MSSVASGREQRRSGVFEWFVHSEVSGSVVLMASAVLALVLANSPLADQYFALQKTYIGVTWGEASFKLSLEHWIKDGLMAIFFFVVGLEIKRELVVGELSTVRQATLPVGAALAGAVVPAAIYLIFHLGGPGERGFAIPMATDIAFALGILALFGSRAPIGLKVFLSALAIADDMLAVSVVALFYTEQIDLTALAFAALFMALIGAANRMRLRQTLVYVALAVGAWAAVLASGIHATIAGVLVALLVPVTAQRRPGEFVDFASEQLKKLRRSGATETSIITDKAQLKAIDSIYLAADETRPPGVTLEHALHPVQSFLIVPLFALFAAGIPLGGELGGAGAPVGLAVALGLILGKQIGIMLGSWVIVASGQGQLPEGVTWKQIWGASALAGVGFTMSIFIGELAFTDESIVNEAKLGVLIGSLVSGGLGYLILNRALPRRV